MTVAIVGGSLTGNRGAASMVFGVIDGLREARPDAKVVVLTPLLSDDLRTAPSAELHDFSARAIVAALFLAVLRRISGGRVAGSPAVRALAEADVVADVSGISFVDSRGGLTRAYNVLLLAPSLVLGTPLVKVSQAMGPFDRPVNRWTARLLLSRLAAVLTRGERSHDLVTGLGISARRADDVAFLMRTTADDEAWARRVGGDEPYVVVSPSAVVVAQAAERGVTYEDMIVTLVEDLAETHTVLLLAHSARPGHPESKLNDLPLCNRIRHRVQAGDRVRLVDPEASAQQMRQLIAGAAVLVTSRFHGMISALAVATPVVVISWSHKYREVLAEFDMTDAAMDFESVEEQDLVAKTRKAIDAQHSIREQIRRRLPAVERRARANVDALFDHLGS